MTAVKWAIVGFRRNHLNSPNSTYFLANSEYERLIRKRHFDWTTGLRMRN